MNRLFATWDEVGGPSGDWTMPEDLAALADKLSPRNLLDLADVRRSEETKTEVGHHRSYLVLSTGAILLVGYFGRDKQYALAWHPTDPAKSWDAIAALAMMGEIDEDDPEQVRLADLSREIERLDSDD